MLYRPGTTIGLTFWKDARWPNARSLSGCSSWNGSPRGRDRRDRRDRVVRRRCGATRLQAGTDPFTRKDFLMAYEELKERQSVMWGNGPYQRVTETLEDIHERVIDTLSPAPGDRWLDLACGTGAIAERAAAGGADVTALDLARAHRNREGACGRAGSRHRVHGRGCGEPPVRGRDLRQGLLDVGDHVLRPTTRPSPVSSRASRRRAGGSRSPTGPRKAAWGRCSRSWRRTNLRHPRARSTGATSPACGSFSATRSIWRSRNMSRRFGCRRSEDYWGALLYESDRLMKTLAESLGERREELHRDWIEFFETNYEDDGEIVHTREYLLISGVRR